MVTVSALRAEIKRGNLVAEKSARRFHYASEPRNVRKVPGPSLDSKPSARIAVTRLVGPCNNNPGPGMLQMTDFRMTLKYEARDIAYAEQHRATELKRAITLLDERKAKLLTELDEAVSASARLDSYQPIIDDTYQCPVCWIKKSEQSPLVPSARSSDDDSYRCRLCEHEVIHEM